MPNGLGCVFTVVVGLDGKGTSTLQFADVIHNFAVKCPLENSWFYEFTTKEGFGIYADPTQVSQGPSAYPVGRRVQGSAFYFTLYNATPGTYEVSVATD